MSTGLQSAGGVDGLEELVLRICRERALAGDAVVVVLHDPGLAAAYAHRVVILSAGRAVADGPPAEIFTDRPVLQVTVWALYLVPTLALFLSPMRLRGGTEKTSAPVREKVEEA